VFADIISISDPSIDPERVEQLIGPRTKAVAAVHFAGFPAPVDVLRELCDRHGLLLIEDAAHAPSTTLKQRKLGTWGDAGCFSFFSNKVLSVGEGGLVTTDSDEIAARVRSLRSHGMTSGTWERHTRATTSYDVTEIGFNFRLDEPRAALLLSRMTRIEADIEQRRVLMRAYRDRLAQIDGVLVPYRDDQVDESSCYVMPIMVTDVERRDDVRRAMRDRHGVQTSLFYPAIHEFSVYADAYQGASLPNTELAARSEITLPLYPHMTAAEQDAVIVALEDALSR
jgi:dTDP-4-amino-4,6-dideoxygalactose transaminase